MSYSSSNFVGAADGMTANQAIHDASIRLQINGGISNDDRRFGFAALNSAVIANKRVRLKIRRADSAVCPNDDQHLRASCPTR